MSKQINGKMIEVPNMYRSPNTNYVQTLDLVLLNILYLIINLTRLKDASPLQRQFVIQTVQGNTLSATLWWHDSQKFQVGCGLDFYF